MPSSHALAHRIADALGLQIREASDITVDNGKTVTGHARRGEHQVLQAVTEHLEQTRE